MKVVSGIKKKGDLISTYRLLIMRWDFIRLPNRDMYIVLTLCWYELDQIMCQKNEECHSLPIKNVI
jgi:hypothetical protein